MGEPDSPRQPFLISPRCWPSSRFVHAVLCRDVRAVLLVRMRGGADPLPGERIPGYGDSTAYTVYGGYTALVYMTPFFGGMFADRLLECGERSSLVGC